MSIPHVKYRKIDGILETCSTEEACDCVMPSLGH